MIEFLRNYAVFAALLGVIVAVLLLVTFARVGYSIRAFREHWKTTGDGAPEGIIGALIVVSLLALLAFAGNRAFGAEIHWFEGTTVYAGVDRTFKGSPQCETNPVDDRLTSNVGVRQDIARVRDVSVLANYTHHSCAVGVDAAGYDGVGLMLEWRFTR